MTTPRRLPALLLFLTSALALHAQDAPPGNETRLRQALRDVTLQLRDAQNQAVTLQAAQTASDTANKDLQAKVDTLNAQITTLLKQAADDKTARDKTTADLTAKLNDQTGQIARLTAAKDALSQDVQQQTLLAAAKEDARAKLALQNALLQRTLDQRETQNLELYRTATEILTRYEKFSLGEALAAKEPFSGLTKVKLQAQIQDYKDKILDSTPTAGQAPNATTRTRTGKEPPSSAPTPAKT